MQFFHLTWELKMIYIFTFPSGPFYNKKNAMCCIQSMRAREKERKRKRKREREWVCLCMWERESVSLSLYVCVCKSVSKKKWERVTVIKDKRQQSVFFRIAFICIVFYKNVKRFSRRKLRETKAFLKQHLKINWRRQAFIYIQCHF